MFHSIEGNTALDNAPEGEESKTFIVNRSRPYMSPEIAARLRKQQDEQRRKQLQKLEVKKSSHRIMFEHFLKAGDLMRAFLYLAEVFNKGYDKLYEKEDMKHLFLKRMEEELRAKHSEADKSWPKIKVIYNQMKKLVEKEEFDEGMVVYLSDLVRKNEQQEMEEGQQRTETVEEAFVTTAKYAFDNAIRNKDLFFARQNLITLKEAVGKGEFDEREFEKRRIQYLELVRETGRAA